MSDSSHLGGAYPCGDANTFMPDVFGYLALRYNAESMLDLGCGYGHTMKWFNDLLVSVRGVEGWEDAIKGHLLPDRVLSHDYTTGPASLGNERFDLGWASEFVEHVEERFIPHYMADLQRCRLACITHAEPGQCGHHHCNLKRDDWWIDTFAAYGFSFDPVETARLRLTDRWHSGWGRRTLMLFHRLPREPLAEPTFVPLVPIYDAP